MRLVRFILLIIFSQIINQCTDSGDSEQELKQIKLSIINESSSELSIEKFNKSILLENINFKVNDRKQVCTYKSPGFNGFLTCDFDSIVFKFENQKGYICIYNGIEQHQSCLPSVSLFEFIMNSKDPDGGQFDLIITEKDYKNAKELF